MTTSPFTAHLAALLTILEDEDLPCHNATIFNNGNYISLSVPTDDAVHLWGAFLEKEPVMRPYPKGGLQLAVAGIVRGLDFDVSSVEIHTSKAVS